jgi:hypothetical protein
MMRTALCLFVLSGVAGPALAQELLPECEWERAVKQASLYAEDGELAAARGELEMVLQTRDGPDHAEVWFAYALVAFEQGDVATAGAAMDRIYEMNERGELPEVLPPWAERFIGRYEEAVGKLVLEHDRPLRVAFSASVESAEDKARAEALLAREDGVLVRSTLSPIYLPPGVYRLGDARVEVRPASERPVVVPLASVGAPAALAARAEGADPPPPFPVVPSTFLERCRERALPELVAAAPPPPGPSFAEGPWPWILGGVALVGAGAAAAAVALHRPDWRLSFETGEGGLGR